MGKNIERLFIAIITLLIPFSYCVKPQLADGLALKKLGDYEVNYGTVQVSSEISVTQSGRLSNNQSGSQPISEQSAYVSNEIRLISYWLWNP